MDNQAVTVRVEDVMALLPGAFWEKERKMLMDDARAGDWDSFKRQLTACLDREARRLRQYHLSSQMIAQAETLLKVKRQIQNAIAKESWCQAWPKLKEKLEGASKANMIVNGVFWVSDKAVQFLTGAPLPKLIKTAAKVSIVAVPAICKALKDQDFKKKIKTALNDTYVCVKNYAEHVKNQVASVVKNVVNVVKPKLETFQAEVSRVVSSGIDKVRQMVSSTGETVKKGMRRVASWLFS